MVTEKQREAIGSHLDWLVKERARVHYPPIINGRIIRQESVAHIYSFEQIQARVLSADGWTVDCSQFVIANLLAVGLIVPHPDGFTGTLLNDLPSYKDPRQMYCGGLAVYGEYPGHHVTICRHRDSVRGNPVQCSQGSEPDPHMIQLFTEAAFQPHGVTLLSIAGLHTR